MATIVAAYFYMDTNSAVDLISPSRILMGESSKEIKDSRLNFPTPANYVQDNELVRISAVEENEVLAKENQRKNFDTDLAQAKSGDFDMALQLKTDIDFCRINFSKSQPFEEMQRGRCGFLTKTDMDTVVQLFQSIADSGNIKAKLYLLENRAENASNEIISAKEAGTQTALADYHKNASADVIRNMEQIALAGNSKAFESLSQMYLRDNIVDYDYDKAMIYALLAQHDWSKPGAEITAPYGLPANATDLARIMPSAVALFNSCCYGKQKSE
jgi:hypothetical protein